MQPPPLAPVSSTNRPNNYSTTLATVAAVCALIAIPFALIPFVGLAASMLVLGFIGAVSIWTRRKRAFIGTGIAFLAVIISIISAFIALAAIIDSRDSATRKLAQIQTQLETAKAQAANTSDKSALAGIIKMFDTKNELSNDQANTLGKLTEWILKSATSDPTPTPAQHQR
jgi:hypothetical protein